VAEDTQHMTGGFFIATYGPMARLWCTKCDKATALEDRPGALDEMQASHRCGPQSTAWDSSGLMSDLT
jgi:hypothetical protein